MLPPAAVRLFGPEHHGRPVSLHDFTDSRLNAGLRLFQQTRLLRFVESFRANLSHSFLSVLGRDTVPPAILVLQDLVMRRYFFSGISVTFT